MTLAIAHYETGRQTMVLDVLRETKPPFSPEAVVEEYSNLLKTYGISSVVGDKYAGIWPSEQFSRFNIRYEASARPKTELYVDLLALLNSARIDLLDHPRLVDQLLGLERWTSRGTGRDVVDHVPHAHDDIANAVAGVAAVCSKYGGYHPWRGWVEDDDEEDPDGARAWRAMRLMQHIQRYG